MNKETDEHIDPAFLFEERIEKAYEQWDEWIATDGSKLEIVTMGDWEADEENENRVKRSFTYEVTSVDEEDEPLCENTFYVKFQKNSHEVVSHKTEEPI